MLVCLWSCKGGMGTSVVSAGLGIRVSHDDPRGALLVDLAGDLALILGLAEPAGPGVVDWLMASDDVPLDALGRLETPVSDGLSLLHRGGAGATAASLPSDRCRSLAGVLAGGARTVVVDCGRLDAGPDDPLVAALLAAADRSVLVIRPCYLAVRRAQRRPCPTEIVVVAETGRALGVRDIESAVGAPVSAVVPWDRSIARSVDGGLLVRRLPRALSRSVRGVR